MGKACSLTDLPLTLVDRIEHYFMTYKQKDPIRTAQNPLKAYPYNQP